MSGAVPADPRPLRLFVALNVADALRARLHTAAAPLRTLVGDAASWQPAASLHLTLRFLGAQPPTLVPPLTAALRSAAAAAEPMTLHATEAGAFPSLDRPRVLWIGLAAHPALARLHRLVDDACAGLGLGRQARPFHPHVTVGRLRPGRRPAGLPAGLRAAAAAVRPALDLPVSTLDLMQSHLSAAGARHACLAALPLGACTTTEVR